MKNWNPLALCLLFLCWASPLFGQGGLEEYQSKALAEMKKARKLGMPAGEGHWEGALEILREATSAYDERALTLFGPEFGWFWYHKGFCELKLNQFMEAGGSFQHCYEEYPNESGAKSINEYHSKSLLKWGEAKQGMQQWHMALKLYRKFLAERGSKQVEFPKGAFYINMAVCGFKRGLITEGLESLQIAVNNKDVFPTPPAGIMAGFQALCEAAIEKKDEAILLDFLKKHRADLTFLPWEAQPYAAQYMNLAAQAIRAEMRGAAFALYSLVPSSIEAEDSLSKALDSIGAYPRPFADGSTIYRSGSLERRLQLSRERTAQGRSSEVTALAATAYLHEQYGNIRGAHVAYELLERYHQQVPTEQRQAHLYQLVRTASLLGLSSQVVEYGRLFSELFPESESVGVVQGLMLTSLFYQQQYEACLELAEELEPTLEKPSKVHDVCLHVLGGSLFYAEQFTKAAALLQRHRQEYPESEFQIAAQYFEASNEVRLQQWESGGKLLDEFLEKHPDFKANPYLPYALQDRASCYYSQGEPQAAIDQLIRIEADSPQAQNLAGALVMKGKILQAEDQLEEAKSAFVKALQLAETSEQGEKEGEVLQHLVQLLGGREETYPEALVYYDQFGKTYKEGSPYQAAVVIAGFPALQAEGRGSEGLEALQGVVVRLAKDPHLPDFDKAARYLASSYLEVHGIEKSKTLFYDFPSIKKEDRATQALLRMSLIESYSNQEQVDPQVMESFFIDLKQDFDLKVLPSTLLVSLGDYVRGKTKEPRQAIPYYEEALKRPETEGHFSARFGLADIYGDSQEVKDLEVAVELLRATSSPKVEKKQQEKALFRLIEVLAKQEQWAEVEESAKSYLASEEGFDTYIPFVSFLLGQSYEEQGQVENALTIFGGIYGSYTGLIQVSAPAVRQYIALLWKRNQPATDKQDSDKQFAYNVGSQFLQQVSQVRTRVDIPEVEKALLKEIKELLRAYGADPEVKSVE